MQATPARKENGIQMQISVIRPAELGPAELAAWRDLQRQTESLANPFLGPEFAVAVGGLRAGARVAVLAEGPDIVGFFPFEKQRLGGAAPIGAGLTDCQGLVHAPGLEWDPRQLLRACGISAWQFDHLVAGQLPFERYQAARAASPVIDLTDGFDAYHARLRARSRQFCSNLARKARKLGREEGELRFVLDSRDAAALRIFMSWKSDQYRRTGRADRFDRPWIVELIDSLFSTHTDGFSGQLSCLYAGDALVAAHFGVRSAHVLADWFPTYATSFGRYSPGLIMHLRMAEESAAAGVRQIDMGKGAKRYKEALKSGDLFVAEGIVTGRSVLGAASWVRRYPALWAERQVRAHPPLFAAADRLLLRYGQVRSSLRPAPAPAMVSQARAAAGGTS
jgi:CelD/BcsL family acetyltransferase involved in cellulose biosynthesis